MKGCIAILGDGAWGTSLGILLAKKGYDIFIWSPFEEHARKFTASKENTIFLPGIPLHERMTIGTDLRRGFGQAKFIVASTPTPFLREVLTKGKPHYNPAIPVVSVGKGIETTSLATRTQIIREVLGARITGVLSGPSHAEEIAREKPAALVAASHDAAFTNTIQEAFSSERFRVYRSGDTMGVELGGALKNVIAIAAGICVGLELGDNAMSALITRGILEMSRIGAAMGARQDTFFGLSGIGDLITTCVSPFGRNRHVGIEIGKGKSLDAITSQMKAVAEGVLTCQSVQRLCREKNIEAPITEEIYRTLYEGKAPVDALDALMLRELKMEW